MAKTNQLCDQLAQAFCFIVGRGFKRVPLDDICRFLGAPEARARRLLTSFVDMNLLDRDRTGYRMHTSLLSIVSGYGADMSASIAEQTEQRAIVERAQASLNRLVGMKQEDQAKS